MDHRLTPSQPNLLMISHCVPDAMGGQERTRAWQMMKTACQTHRVFLACLLDAPANLAQWRTINATTQRIALELKPAERGLIRRVLGLGLKTSAVIDSAFHQSIRKWTLDHLFDAVLCTHPGLWPYARDVKARLRVCDIHSSRGYSQPPDRTGIARIVRGPRRPGHDPTRRSENEQRVLAECDAVLLGHRSELLRLDGSVNAAVVVETMIDPLQLEQLRPAASTRSHKYTDPAVAFHCDWSHPQSQQRFNWFKQQVWPTIHRSVPDAHLTSTAPGTGDPYSTLSHATVAVAPIHKPGTAPLAALQAMAMRRTVIASGNTAELLNLGACDGEHLVFCYSDDRWGELCVGLLQSASDRLRLSNNAGMLIHRLPNVEQAGLPLTQALANPDQPSVPTTRAA